MKIFALKKRAYKQLHSKGIAFLHPFEYVKDKGLNADNQARQGETAISLPFFRFLC